MCASNACGGVLSGSAPGVGAMGISSFQSCKHSVEKRIGSHHRLLFFIQSIIEYHFVLMVVDEMTSHQAPPPLLPVPPLLLEHFPQQKPLYDKPPVVLSSHQDRNKYVRFHGLERESVCL